MMQLLKQYGALLAGLAVGNAVMHRLVFDRPWFDAIGIGVSAALVAIGLLVLVNWVRR